MPSHTQFFFCFFLFFQRIEIELSLTQLLLVDFAFTLAHRFHFNFCAISFFLSLLISFYSIMSCARPCFISFTRRNFSHKTLIRMLMLLRKIIPENISKKKKNKRMKKKWWTFCCRSLMQKVKIKWKTESTKKKTKKKRRKNTIWFW